MIDARFNHRDGKISDILITGHAQFKKKGEDIICAAVSTAIILTVNLIERFGFESNIDSDIKDGYFTLSVKQNHPTISIVLDNLEDSLIDLKEQYPKHISYQKEG